MKVNIRKAGVLYCDRCDLPIVDKANHVHKNTFNYHITCSASPTKDSVNQIILGDCLTVMRGFDDACIDLTVTSPPYDNLRTYGGYSFDFEPIARELYRVTKDGGVAVWVVGDQTKNGSESGTSFKQALYFKEMGFNLHDTMIYQKKAIFNYDPRNMRCKQSFEYMFVFSKGKPITYNEIKDVPVVKRGMVASGEHGRTPDGMKRSGNTFTHQDFQARSNIWAYATGNNLSTKDKVAFQHPAIFPEQLAHDHIISWSNEGDTILDPFNGSGTTTKIAKKLNRNYIGIEINPEYVKIAQDRLKQEVLL